MDVCLSLNDKAEFFINRRIGKEISVHEALEILDKARQHDLVHAVNDVENPECLCGLCSCRCPQSAVKLIRTKKEESP